MRVRQAFHFELDPNNATRAKFASHAGTARFAFNWGLALVEERLARRAEIRTAGFKQLLSDEAVKAAAGNRVRPSSWISRTDHYRIQIISTATEVPGPPS